jgi:hypothetical protein
VERKHEQAQRDLSTITALVQDYASRGEVLFITQRQLLVFGVIPGVTMTTDYELLTLSEMAISNNQSYLTRFYQDLENHRFTMIVMDYQSGELKDPLFDSFAEENNAWRDHIAPPLKKYYQQKIWLDAVGIELFVPLGTELP